MSPLDDVIRQASQFGSSGGNSPATQIHATEVQPGAGLQQTSAVQEVARQLQICNACRYCEGFCAVFPAMTRRLEFGTADVHYLANLCHNCGACLHACQYAPPHEFAVNVPQAMARVRVQTYAEYAWPPTLGQLYQRNGLTLAAALVIGLSLFLVIGAALNGGLTQIPANGNFYGIFPHGLLVSLFLPVFAFVVVALTVGVRTFLRAIGPATGSKPAAPAAVTEAAGHALTLTYLGGGHGEGCNNEDDAYALWRRRMHHLTFYGFMLCFAATAVGTLYHYAFGWHAPYSLPSLPKLLGSIGGLSLVIGTAGLWHLNRTRDPQQGDLSQKPMDLGFIALLFTVSLSGLLLWWCGGTRAMPIMLCLHLGSVMALFLTLPYGKFAHGVFRSAALVRDAVEKRTVKGPGLGD